METNCNSHPIGAFITWFMLGTKLGSIIINKIASFFSWLLACANEGIRFAFPSAMESQHIDFFFSALLPIILLLLFRYSILFRNLNLDY